MFESKQITRKKLEEILLAQEIKLRNHFNDKEIKLRKWYEEKLEEVHKQYQKQIEEINFNHSKIMKDTSIRRLEKYKELIQEKNDLIKNLEKENKELRFKISKYKTAYNLYRDSRDSLISLAKEMSNASEHITLTTARLSQYFNRLADLADAQHRIGVGIDKKIEEKMYVDDISDDMRLKLVESQTS